MPVSNQDISSSIQLAATFPGGNIWDIFCDSIGDAVASWITVPANVKLRGATAGATGAGTVQGKLLFPPNPTMLIQAIRSGGSPGGNTTDRVATAVAIGIATSLSKTALYTGPSVGVATGTDISRVVYANQLVLGTLLNASLTGRSTARGGHGPYSPAFMFSLASGISSMILQGGTLPGTGVVVPSGPVAPMTGVGTSPLSNVI